MRTTCENGRDIRGKKRSSLIDQQAAHHILIWSDKIKKTVNDKDLKYDITSKKAKSGNMVLEVPNKEQADLLANFLKIELGETTGIRRLSPTVRLFLLSIEDSVEETVLRSAIEAFDIVLKNIMKLDIRECRSILRTAVIRTPLRAGRRLISEKKIKIGWECVGSRNSTRKNKSAKNSVRKVMFLKIAWDLKREDVLGVRR